MNFIKSVLVMSLFSLALQANATTKTFTGKKAEFLMDAAANAGYAITPDTDAPHFYLTADAFYCVYAFQVLPESMPSNFSCAKGIYYNGNDNDVPLTEAGLLSTTLDQLVPDIEDLALTHTIMQVNSLSCDLTHATNSYSCVLDYNSAPTKAL